MSVVQVVRGGSGHDEFYREFIMTADTDVSSLPKDSDDVSKKTSPGSVAYLQDLSKIYLLGTDNTWREV